MGDSAVILRGVGRAFAGALLFSLPIFMTMEMWVLGVSISRYRLALLLLTTIALAMGLSHFLGLLKHPEPRWRDSLVDAGVALLVGITAAALILWALSVIEPASYWRDALSIVAIEALPATIGASFARSQLGAEQQPSGQSPSYLHEVFLMVAGAVVFATNVAPTEEVVLLAAKMSEIEGLLLVALELALMHGFVYGVGFKGGSQSSRGFWPAFRDFTLVGYAVALAVSGYMLWSLGRFDGTGALPVVTETIVLALPASVGAASARLIL